MITNTNIETPYSAPPSSKPGKPQTSAPASATPSGRTFILRNRQGLHHRPAMLLVNTLKDFKCSVRVEVDGFTADSRDIFGLLSLAAGPGSKFTFTATGKDAGEALDALQRVFDCNFAAAYL